MRPLLLLLLLAACDNAKEAAPATSHAPSHAVPNATTPATDAPHAAGAPHAGTPHAGAPHGTVGKPVIQQVCETIIAVMAEIPPDQQDAEGFRYRQQRQQLGRNMGAQMVLRGIQMRAKEVQPAHIAALAEVTDSRTVCEPLIQDAKPTPAAKTDVGKLCYALEYAVAALPEKTPMGNIQKWLDIWTKEALADSPNALAHYTQISASEPYARQAYMAEQIIKENAERECTAWKTDAIPTKPVPQAK